MIFILPLALTLLYLAWCAAGRRADEREARMTQLYTRKNILCDLRELVNRMSSQKALAEKIGISEQYLTDILKERRKPGPKVIQFLGYEYVEAYKESEK